MINIDRRHFEKIAGPILNTVIRYTDKALGESGKEVALDRTRAVARNEISSFGDEKEMVYRGKKINLNNIKNPILYQ